MPTTFGVAPRQPPDQPRPPMLMIHTTNPSIMTATTIPKALIGGPEEGIPPCDADYLNPFVAPRVPKDPAGAAAGSPRAVRPDAQSP